MLLLLFAFLLLYLESDFLSIAFLTVAFYSELESEFVFRSQLGPSMSGSSPGSGLQVVTQPIHLMKDCYPLLTLNPHHDALEIKIIAIFGILTQ